MLHYSKCSYYPFGMTMPGRKFSSLSQGYRYGFNGKENDKDAGEGIQDYGMRIYSERLGKFLSVDPLTKKYPFYGPYNFAANTPINAVDIDGLEIDPSKNQNLTEHVEVPDKYKGGAIVTKDESLHAPPIIKGVVKGGLNLLGAVTQILAAPHQAPRQRQEVRESNFALIGGKELSIKAFIAGIFIAPADAISAMANSNDGEVWGESLFNLYASLSPVVKATGIMPAKVISYKAENGLYTAYYGKNTLGTFEWNGNTGLSLNLDIPKNLQNLGLGSQIFKTATEVTGQQKFTATWIRSELYENGSSINLQRYNQAIESGKTVEQAAWSTWSGKQAKLNGFNNVVVSSIANEGIRAVFTK